MPVAFVVDFKHIRRIIMMEDQCWYHKETSQLIWIANQSRLLTEEIRLFSSNRKWEMPRSYRYGK